MTADTITIPLEDYERLLEASDADEMLVTCEVCGAWIDRNDAACATTDDFTGCWKAASGGKYNECRAYRAHALEAARLQRTQRLSRANDEQDSTAKGE